MTYLQRSSVQRNSKVKKFKVFSLILLILVFGVWFRGFTSSTTHSILVPVNNLTSSVFSPFVNIANYFGTVKELREYNNQLIDENKGLKIEVRDSIRLKEENIELRNLLNIHQEARGEIFEVILTPPFSPYDTFIVTHKGNITIGDSVYIKNILVGEVIEVFEKTAIAKLFSSHESNIPIRIYPDIIAEASGLGGLDFSIQLPKDFEIDQSLPVYSMENPDTIVGFISHIEKTEASSFQTIYFQYPFDWVDFRFVEVR